MEFITIIYITAAFGIGFIAGLICCIIATVKPEESTSTKSKEDGPDDRRFIPPYPGAKCTHYECNWCGGTCDSKKGHDLCNDPGAQPCYCNLWKDQDARQEPEEDKMDISFC